MPSFSPENWHLIPVIPQIGSLIDPYGGRTVESYVEEDPVRIVERDNEICWEVYTSREIVSFSLIQDGFKAIFHDLGVGTIYDSEGNLSAVRIEVLPFLDGLLDKYVETDDDELDTLFGLADFLDEYNKDFEAHLDLSSGQFLIRGINGENEEMETLATGKNDSFEMPAILTVTIGEFLFCITFQKCEDSLVVGVGVREEDGDELSPIGNLSIEKDKREFDVSLLTIYLANDCNYMTYLDNTNADRFDRLARRIITD